MDLRDKVLKNQNKEKNKSNNFKEKMYQRIKKKIIARIKKGKNSLKTLYIEELDLRDRLKKEPEFKDIYFSTYYERGSLVDWFKISWCVYE